jgi:CheY-like chemotaxis protein
VSADATVRRVLIVEDNPAIRTTLRDVLELEGYAVQTARNGAEGLALLTAACPDLLVLDLMMPVVDGWAVLEQRRAQTVCPQVPVLLLSASRETVTTAEQQGVSAYLEKPFDLDTFLAQVARLCPLTDDV